ncbi:MAG: hypothetical protein ACI8WB_004727 [Phenylobacterium sp.]|jgi:hypothetical protein
MSLYGELKALMQQGIVDITTPDHQNPVLKTVLSMDGDSQCFVDANRLTEELMTRHIKKVEQKQNKLINSATAIQLFFKHFAKYLGAAAVIYTTYVALSDQGWQQVVTTFAATAGGSAVLHQLLKLACKWAFKGIM